MCNDDLSSVRFRIIQRHGRDRDRPHSMIAASVHLNYSTDFGSVADIHKDEIEVLLVVYGYCLLDIWLCLLKDGKSIESLPSETVSKIRCLPGL
jgi:hypothetical protein